MTGNLNALHPTPNAEVLADMEIQPEHYDVISTGGNYSREDAEQVGHARARVVIAIGKGLSRDEVHEVVVRAVAELHAFLETKHTLRLDYVPGTGAGPHPADAAIPTTWVCGHCHAVNDPDTEHCATCTRWHAHRGRPLHA